MTQRLKAKICTETKSILDKAAGARTLLVIWTALKIWAEFGQYLSWDRWHFTMTFHMSREHRRLNSLEQWNNGAVVIVCINRPLFVSKFILTIFCQMMCLWSFRWVQEMSEKCCFKLFIVSNAFVLVGCDCLCMQILLYFYTYLLYFIIVKIILCFFGCQSGNNLTKTVQSPHSCKISQQKRKYAFNAYSWKSSYNLEINHYFQHTEAPMFQ